MKYANFNGDIKSIIKVLISQPMTEIKLRRVTHLFVLLFLSFNAFAQVKNISPIDKYAASVGYYSTIDTLQSKLTKASYSDSEKVRSYFYWITQRISYDIEDYHKNTYTYPVTTITDSAAARSFWNEHYASYVLKNKKAVCEGYAVVFKLLCDRANIPCMVIHGSSRGKPSDIGKPFKGEGHAWNAVKVNGKWRLVDVCWASGYCNDATTKFTKLLDERYYMTPPDIMIYDHYPAIEKWALLKIPPPKNVFTSLPILYDKKHLLNTKNCSIVGNFESVLGDTINIEVEFIADVHIEAIEDLVSINEYDSKDNFIIHEADKPVATFKLRGKRLTCSYPVWSKNVTSLYLSYDSENLTAYKLKVK